MGTADGRTEEVLFEFDSPTWPDGKLPVTLITWASGGADVHAQTGEGHVDAIKRARGILKERGLAVGEAALVGPTGIYYPVIRITNPEVA